MRDLTFMLSTSSLLDSQLLCFLYSVVAMERRYVVNKTNFFLIFRFSNKFFKFFDFFFRMIARKKQIIKRLTHTHQMIYQYLPSLKVSQTFQKKIQKRRKRNMAEGMMKTKPTMVMLVKMKMNQTKMKKGKETHPHPRGKNP